MQSLTAELIHYIKRLYEDNVNGKPTINLLWKHPQYYEFEQRELKGRAAVLQGELNKAQEATINAEKFMSAVRMYEELILSYVKWWRKSLSMNVNMMRTKYAASTLIFITAL